MKIEENVSLAPLTTFRVGGSARFFVRAASVSDIAEALVWAREHHVPYFILGGGTNVLVADEGFSGLVIKIENSDLEVREDGTIMAGAGVSMGRVVQEAMGAGLTGFEWAAGLPGTVGGAVFGNAGAFGHETGELVEAVSVIRSDGTAETTMRHALNFRYRWSSFKGLPGTTITAAAFRLERGDKAEIEAAMRAAMTARRDHQPLADQSAGCIFKNPVVDIMNIRGVALGLASLDAARDMLGRQRPTEAKQLASVPAGKLIDECGLKGTRVGGAEVSPKHANFIVNTGAATARDIAELISFIKDRVREKTGIALEEEIRFLSST